MSVAVLVAAACVYFVVRTPRAESPRRAAVEPLAADVELAGRRSLVAEEPPGGVSAVAGTNVLRVLLEGITEEDARRTRVTLTGVDKRAFDPRLATTEQRRDYVQWIQRSLNRVLGTRLAVDGQLGPLTRRAIITFQRREGLPTHGRVGPKTEGALIRYDGTHSYAPRWPAEIRDSWPCQGLTSEFDLDPFFAVVAEQHEDLRVDELEVSVDHPLHLIERTRVPLSRGVERKSGQTVYEVRVRLVPAAVIHGRLAREDGDPASEGLVGALLLEGDFPIDADGRAVECAADGAFELRVPASGLYALASYEEGRRPTTTRVDALVGTRVDVGTLVLESGHAITGHARRQGKPLAGASVSATPPTWKTAAAPDDVDSGMHASVYEGRTFATPARSVHLLWLPPAFTTHATGPGSRRSGRFELAGQRVSVDADGAFSFVGLGSGEYLLRMRGLAEAHDSVPGYWDRSKGKELYRIHGDRPALVVRAPAHGVVLKFRWTSIRFELAGDLESEDEGRLLLKTRSGAPPGPHPRIKGLSIAPEFLSTHFPLAGAEPTFVLQAPPNQRILGEVAFRGRQPVPLDFRTPDDGGEMVVPVRLERAEKLATLVIELENPREKIPETFSVLLWRAGQDAFPPDTRLVEVAEGRLRVEGIFPGEYRVRVRAGRDMYSQGLFHQNEFDVELHPSLVVTRSIMMRQGAGLRFTVRGEDGALLSGEYEFFDHSGSPVDLNTYVRWEDRRGASSWKIYPHGTHESFNELHPGRYRLVLRSKGYAERSVTVELRAGAYEDVDVTLSK